MKILSAEFVKGVVAKEGIPTDGLPQIAFAGRSNAGKSSLQNALLGRKKLVRVSNTPGKTQEMNFYLINNAFYFVDLPGIGFAKVHASIRRKMTDMLAEYTANATNLKGLIYLIDTKTSGTAIDLHSVESLREMNIPLLLVGTKNDKLNQKERSLAVKKIQEKFELDHKPLLTSSLKKQGLEELWEQITEAIITEI